MNNETTSNANDHIYDILSTLPAGTTTISQIQVDDVLVDVTSFINLNRTENLAYFTSPIGTTLIVDCHKISLLVF
ncbi:hypothetical protein [Sporosarcina sp. UB5]|uniref:hypothetical protein n=1 Tax=Sporosarcina sp. UB5 TaxID=3047463 RepID=UPI003D7A1B52